MTNEANRWRSAALLLVSSLTVMSNATIAPSMPQMAEVFRDTPNAELLSKLIITIPALFIVVCAPLAGAFIDRFGRIRFLYANLVLYGLAGASGYVLDELQHILAGRALLGVAVAGIMTTASTLTGDYFSGEARTRFAGTQSIFMSLGAVVFTGAGGLLAEFDWRLPFLVYLASWIILVPAAKFLHEPVRHARHVADGPIVPVPVPALALAYLLTFFGLVMFYMTPVQMPFLLRDIGVPSSALAGGAIAVSSLASMGGPLVLRRLHRRTGFVAAYALSILVIAAGYGIVALAPSYSVLLLGASISGFGAGIMFPTFTLWIISLSPPRLRGRLLGVMTASLHLGQFSSPILVQPAVASVGMGGAFGVSAAVATVVAAALLVAGRKLGRASPRVAGGPR